MRTELPEGFDLHQWTPSEVTRFWDFISQTQPGAYFSDRVGSNIAWNFRREIASADRVLDYGCGSGRFLEEILAFPCTAAGYDTSPKSREITRSRVGHQSQFLGVLGTDDISDHSGTFDLAFCLEVVEHLYDDQLDAALAEVYSLLRTGGRFVVTTPNDEDLSENWICNPTTGTVFHRWQHVRSWTAQSLSERLSDAGFEPEKSQICNAEALGTNWRAVGMRAAFAALRRGQAKNLFVVVRKR